MPARQQTLRFGDAWARLGPWRGGGRVAHLVVAPDAPLSGEAVLACLKRARAAGYEEVLTSAIGPAEEERFVEARFTVRERLHLLTHEIDEEPRLPARRSGTEPARPVTRATRRDRAAVLALDDVAFDTFWRLAALGLRDALDATPVHQFRATRSEETLTGYAITGRAGSQGYLQRVAVHPDAQRQGWGTALVADAMHWLWRHGAVRAFVNTQLENDAALSLYESFGFSVLPAGLAVLGRSL
ncbi:MAG: GNAT family N-acetyltransferase [Acidimicrobiia bacterium]